MLVGEGGHCGSGPGSAERAAWVASCRHTARLYVALDGLEGEARAQEFDKHAWASTNTPALSLAWLAVLNVGSVIVGAAVTVEV
jgi:hypothetical protein